MLAPLSRFELTSESLVTARRNGTAPRAVTVVIAAYDALPYLDEQLEALAAQTYAGDVEVIGGWNSEFVPGEDIEICWRAQLRGYTLGYSSKAVVAYRLRATIGDTWRQALYYMDGEARVAKEFRPSGVRGRPVLHWAVHLLWLMLRCPIFPGNWSRAHRGKWVFSAGIVVGRIRGSIAHRVFYP